MLPNGFQLYGRWFQQTIAGTNGALRFQASDGSTVVVTAKPNDSLIDVSINADLKMPDLIDSNVYTSARFYTGFKIQRPTVSTENTQALLIAALLRSNEALIDPDNSVVAAPTVAGVGASYIDLAKDLMRL